MKQSSEYRTKQRQNPKTKSETENKREGFSQTNASFCHQGEWIKRSDSSSIFIITEKSPKNFIHKYKTMHVQR